MAVAMREPELRIVDAANCTIIDLDPLQGTWSSDQYLRLARATNRLIEFTAGRIEVLPMPTKRHQAIAGFLYAALRTLMQQIGGAVFFSGLELQITPDKYRLPDILLLRDAVDPRGAGDPWLGADLVVEVVSPDNPERDTRTKRLDYAEVGVLEYWIVNPQKETITVLRLAGKRYIEHAVFRRGETAISALLPEFAVAVDEVLDARF